jgi:hypothetical protein
VTARSLLLTGLFGAVATRVLIGRIWPLDIVEWDFSATLMAHGAVAAVLVGRLAWALMKPSLRLSRASVLCVCANTLVWTWFLLSPAVPESEFARIAAERAGRNVSGMELVEDAPTILAGRWHGVYGAVNAADRWLTLFAAPATWFAEALVVPPMPGVTRAESMAVAVLAFVFSTAFWVAAPDIFRGLRRAYRQGVRVGWAAMPRKLRTTVVSGWVVLTALGAYHYVHDSITDEWELVLIVMFAVDRLPLFGLALLAVFYAYGRHARGTRCQ